jgi:hypothetical protein
MIDVWEIAYVWAWPVISVAEVAELEPYIFSRYDCTKPLMNGKVLTPSPKLTFCEPDIQIVQVIHEDERQDRLQPSQRLPRQIQHYHALVDYIQTVKDEPHLKRSLRAHFERLVSYHERFLA